MDALVALDRLVEPVGLKQLLLGDALRRGEAMAELQRLSPALWGLAGGRAADAERWHAEVAGELAARSIPGTLVAVDHGRGVLDLARGDLLAARAALDRAAAGWRERRRFWEGTWARLDQARCALAARRVAAGNTNRQIAAELFLSPKTVGSHVEHILTKLGAARRAEIAAWVAALPPGPGPAAG